MQSATLPILVLIYDCTGKIILNLPAKLMKSLYKQTQRLLIYMNFWCCLLEAAVVPTPPSWVPDGTFLPRRDEGHNPPVDSWWQGGSAVPVPAGPKLAHSASGSETDTHASGAPTPSNARCIFGLWCFLLSFVIINANRRRLSLL